MTRRASTRAPAWRSAWPDCSHPVVVNARVADEIRTNADPQRSFGIFDSSSRWGPPPGSLQAPERRLNGFSPAIYSASPGDWDPGAEGPGPEGP